MRRWKLLFTAVVCHYAFGSPELPASPEWRSYVNSDQIIHVTDSRSVLWAASSAGLTALRKSDGFLEVFGIHSGPRSLHISSIALAANGEVWVATLDKGLSRFDGGSWSAVAIVGKDDKPLLRVNSLAVDRNGRLWMAAGGVPGATAIIAYFDHGDWTGYDNENWDGTLSVSKLLVDSRNDVWGIGHHKPPNADKQLSAVIRCNAGEFELFSEGVELPDAKSSLSTLNAIAFDSSGSVWVGNNHGVSRYADAKWKRYPRGRSEDALRTGASAIAVDHSNAVWMGGTWGLSRFDGHSWSKIALPFFVPSIRAVNVDGQGRVWAATETTLTCSGDETAWQVFTSDTLLPGSSINGIAAGADGNVLLTTNRGIVRVADTDWERIRNTNAPNGNGVRRIMTAKNGDLWVAYRDSRSGGSLGRYRSADSTWQYFPADNGVISDTIYSLVADRDKSVWIAGVGGVSRFRDDNWRSYALADPSADLHSFIHLARDSAGSIWAVAKKENWNERLKAWDTQALTVHRYDDDEWREISDAGGVSFGNGADGFVEAGPSGALWIASFQLLDTLTNEFVGGLYQFDQGGWTVHNLEDGNDAGFRRAPAGLAVDRDGSVWLAYKSQTIYDENNNATLYPGGLSRYRNSGWRHYRQLESLPVLQEFTNVGTVRIDQFGNKWFAVNNGQGTAGVVRLNNSQASFFPQGEGLLPIPGQVNSIAFGADSSAWFAVHPLGISRLLRAQNALPTNVADRAFANQDFAVLAYPNPVQSASALDRKVTIRISAKQGDLYSCRIFTLQGALLYEQMNVEAEGENLSIDLPLYSFRPAVYFVQVSNQVLSRVVKILVER